MYIRLVSVGIRSSIIMTSRRRPSPPEGPLLVSPSSGHVDTPQDQSPIGAMIEDPPGPQRSMTLLPNMSYFFEHLSETDYSYDSILAHGDSDAQRCQHPPRYGE